jgi:glycosyltransferase involved in cell wall biosynthesis
MEHFGISTVEAMAAGCVPVVINKGAQPEIVEHGVSGFLWNTLEELRAYTIRLIKDNALLESMAQAARRRAQLFSRENYVERCLTLLGPYLSDGVCAPTAIK